LLGGTYRIVRRIGSGGMGEVYEAAHARLAHRYAVKFLHPGMRDHPEALPRFMREAQVTSRLRHPGIVSVVDFNTLPDGVAYLVMEYLEGEPLGKVLARTGPLPLSRVVDITDQLSSALTAAHLEGVVHRDMHPQNVFVMPATGGQTERVKILDFGISKIASISQKITGMAAVLGTPQYMSPEQAEGKIDQLDAASDQFSLAAIVYEMLTGRPAFSGGTLASVAYQIVHAAAAPIREFRPGLPGELDQVLSRALAKDQKARFPSVSEFALHFRWTANLPVNEKLQGSHVDGGNAPAVEADIEETTAVSALPSGMAEVLRQTSGLSPRADALLASAPTGSAAAESAQNEPTVVRPSVFANNEPTVVSPWSLATEDPSLLSKAPFGEDDLPGARGMRRRPARFWAVAVAGLFLVVGAALLAVRGGARPAAGIAGTSPSAATRAPASSAPTALPAPAPVRQTAPAPGDTTASVPAPRISATAATASSPTAAAGEAGASEKPLARGHARLSAPLKAAAPTSVDHPGSPTAAAACRITVGSYPWSDLWIDGANTGQQTPVVGLPVTCGPHRLEFKRRDLKVDQEERVTVNEGWEFKREYELQGAALDE
jgi:eukaryotic-like serine/threonine-protein kinase